MARALDKNGSGKAFFPIWWASLVLSRSESTIWQYLTQCKRLGLFRSFKVFKNHAFVYYSSLSKAAMSLGLNELGPCSNEICLSELEALPTIATELEAYHLQSQSFYAAKLEHKQSPVKLIKPFKFFESPACGKLARVIGFSKSGRFAFCSENFKVFGASQAGISERRGLSIRQIQRHLDNSYRSGISPVRKFRRGFNEIFKVQILQRCSRDDNFRLRSANRWGDDSAFNGLIQGNDGRFWKFRPNLYLDYRWLLRIKVRRHFYKKSLISKNATREIAPISLGNESLESLGLCGVDKDNSLEESPANPS